MLARFFAWLDRALRPAPVAGEQPVPPPPAPESVVAPVFTARPAPDGAGARVPLALLSVDDGGQYLLAGAERVTFGHLRAGRADLGFLADVGALHAELLREDSLRDGPGWRVVPLGGEPVAVDGRSLSSAGARLRSGARLKLGANLELVFRVPDPASASALLELQHGIECHGARRVLLAASGPGGRFMLGAGARHALRVPGLEMVLVFEHIPGALVLSSEVGAVTGEPAPPSRLPFPPSERLCLSFGAARGSRPPFQCFLEPLPLPGGPR